MKVFISIIISQICLLVLLIALMSKLVSTTKMYLLYLLKITVFVSVQSAQLYFVYGLGYVAGIGAVSK